MSTAVAPTRHSLISVRMGELEGWCGMLCRRHPDMADTLSGVLDVGREILSELGTDRLLSVGIVGEAVEAYNRKVSAAEPGTNADEEPAEGSHDPEPASL